jgi:PAS domain S-box-containing protein
MARVHPEDRATRDEAIRRALDPQGEYAMEYRVVLPDGQVRWMTGLGRYEFGDSKPLRMRGVSFDITRRRQAELEAAQQRSASERQLQDIIDNTTSIIFVKDLELRYLQVNREYERRFNVRRKEIRGKSDFDIHPQAVAEAVCANDRQVIEAGEPIEFEESAQSGGKDHHYVVVKFLLRDRAENPYAVCGVATDITELKRAKALEAEMAREREAFLEEKTRLAGEIHDSLAQSFTGIAMQLGMAKYVLTDRDNELFNYVERANDLAQFGLAEARRSVMSLQSKIVKDSGLIESLQILAERSNIAGRLRCTFRSNLKDDQSLPAAVRQDLLRIAQEAISNALRHAKSTAISVNLRSDPPNLILQVKDNGCGITNEAEAREGFGFANMRARVKKLSGTLDVRTAPGRGTSIVVSVPLGAGT